MIYLDSSALLKLVVREPESAALFRFLQDHPERVSSALARVEVLRVVRRATVSPAIHRRAMAVLERIALVPLEESVLLSAAELEPRSLRAPDSIHLATALSLTPLDAFVVYDARLAEGARAVGCPVVSPT